MNMRLASVLRALGIFAIWLSFAGWVVSAVLLMWSNERPNDIGVLVHQATGGILFLGPLGLILSLPGMVGSAYAVTHAGMKSTIPSIAVSAVIFGVWFGLLGIFIGMTTGPIELAGGAFLAGVLLGGGFGLLASPPVSLNSPRNFLVATMVIWVLTVVVLWLATPR